MNNKNVSDFIAATMNSVLNSAEHKQLFGSQVKTAAKKCKDCHKAMDKCMCSMADDDDKSTKVTVSNRLDAILKEYVKENKDSPYTIKEIEKIMSHMRDYHPSERKEMTEKLKEKTFNSRKEKAEAAIKLLKEFEKNFMPESYMHVRSRSRAGTGISEDGHTESRFDKNDADDAHTHTKQALNVAINGLLTASSALDALNMNHSSELSLKLASLVVQAKKIAS